MPMYEVEFTFSTATSIIIEAATEEEAGVRARQDLEDFSPNSLPEMWAGDFVLSAIQQVDDSYRKETP